MLLDDCYVSFLNLDHRKDRLTHIKAELDKAGINAERTRGKLPEEFDRNDPRLQVQWNRTPGSIGCMMGQMDIMAEAYRRGKSAVIFEDDAILCSDIDKRLWYFSSYLTKVDWDVAWLGGTVHINPPYWHTGVNRDLPGCNFGKDADPTDDFRIIKCYGAFSTYAYVVNFEKIPKVILLLESVMHLSMGIDWSFIKLGEQLNTYMFLPGMVRQMDNISDIGQGITRFSGFAALGDYWYQDKMEDFNPNTLQWK